MHLDLVELIRDANPERSADTLMRRLVKIDEELGELAGAALSATNPTSYKGLTFDDVREEAIDTFIIALDVALTPTGSVFPTDRFVPIAAAYETTPMEMGDGGLLIMIRRASRVFGDARECPDMGLDLMAGIHAIHNIIYAILDPSEDASLIEGKVDAMVRQKVQKWLDTKHLAPLDS